MPSTSRSGSQPAIGLTATTQPRGTSPSPIRQPVSPSASPNGQPVVTSASTSPQATSSSNAVTSQSRHVGQPQRAHSPLLPVSKIWKQCNLTTTLLCTILMVVLGFLLFKPQTLATKLALWESKKDYHEYCKNINQTGSTISRGCLEVLGKGLPPPPSSKLLTRYPTKVPSQIEHAAPSKTKNSALVYRIILFFAISLTCLGILKQCLRGRKKVVSTVELDCLTGEQVLDLPDQYTPPNSGPAWVPNFVVRSVPLVSRSKTIRPGSKEPGWTSTLQIDGKRAMVILRWRRPKSDDDLTETAGINKAPKPIPEEPVFGGAEVFDPFTKHDSKGDSESKKFIVTDADDLCTVASDEEKGAVSKSEQEEWEPVVKLGISHFRKLTSTNNSGVVGGKAEHRLMSPHNSLIPIDFSGNAYPNSEGTYPLLTTSRPSENQDSKQRTEDGSPNFYEGILQKRGRNRFNGYSRRFFCLDFTSSVLSYYRNRTSPALRGSIPLALATIGAMEHGREFWIDSGAESWHLKAKNQSDFEAWKRAFETASTTSASTSS